MNSSQDWFDWSKLREDSEFVIGFFRENLKLVFFSWKHSSSKFFEKNYIPDFWKKKVIFVLLAFETCQGAIWSSHSVIRVLINLHYDPTSFKAFHSASFCEISVRFCHHKNRTQISKNFHCAFLFSIPLSYYNPYDDIPIFFHTWIFLLTSNYDIFTWFLWHLYDVVCVK